MDADGTPAPVRRRRFEAFEAYRGLAALAVVIFHGFQYTREPYPHTAAHAVLHNLDTLVDLFFVLSAFLLTLPWVTAAAGRAAPQSARRYVSRRAWRILPLYWTSILIVWLSRNPRWPGDWRDLVEHLTFTQVFDHKRIFYTIGPAWSLADEVIFYAFLLGAGLGLAHLARRHPRVGGPGGWFMVSVGLIGLGTGWKWWQQFHLHTPHTDWSIWFGPLAKADLFGLGMLLAVAVGQFGDRSSADGFTTASLRLAGIAVVGFAWMWRGPFSSPHEEFVHTLAGAGFVLLLAGSALAPKTSTFERTLAWGPLAALGAISYSVYMWHEPVLLYLGQHHLVLTEAAGTFVSGTALLLVLSVVAGVISYRVIERPAQQLGLALARSRQAAAESRERRLSDAVRSHGVRVEHAPSGLERV